MILGTGHGSFDTPGFRCLAQVLLKFTLLDRVKLLGPSRGFGSQMGWFFKGATADFVCNMVRKTVVSWVMARSDVLKVVFICGCQVRHIGDLRLLIGGHVNHALRLWKLESLASALLSRTVFSIDSFGIVISFDALILRKCWQKVMQGCNCSIWRRVNVL